MDNRLLMFNRGLDFYGVKEVPGAEHNPVIVKWFQDIGHKWVRDDETAWCSCYINWLAWSLNLERSGKLDARSWLGVGYQVTVPRRGHITIFWRRSASDWRGHVGLFVRKEGGYIYVLGGNQDNQVNIKPYPESRLLGYREIDLAE